MNNYFDKTGQLLMKNLQDRFEYHLYDKSVPESHDINYELEAYYRSENKVSLHIESNNQTIIRETGKMYKKKIFGVTKYYIKLVDVELILFNHTGEVVHIEMQRVSDGYEKGS